jgi:hypothetical protein
MSGVEIIAIIACVAGVISAFDDGSKILRQIKKRRARRKALQPPAVLEQSLQGAPQDIEREKALGIARCGQAFAIGDGAFELSRPFLNLLLRPSARLQILQSLPCKK